jgi:hypothetical protein
MARIVAKRLVEHLERSGFVVMKRPPIGGAAARMIAPNMSFTAIVPQLRKPPTRDMNSSE